MLRVNCPHCEQTFTTSGSRPRFCSNCGQPLNESSIIEPAPENDRAVLDRVELQSLHPTPVELHEMPTVVQPSDTGKRSSDLDRIRIVDDSLQMNQAQFATGNSFGEFRIIRKLGEGGMGAVYEVENERTEMRVALKILNRGCLANQDAIDRFQRESQIAASINHPHSTFVYEAGQIDDWFYIAMELMPGGTLKEVVTKGNKLSVGQAVDLILDVIDGLQPAHEAGIVHRDLKPSNCFLDHAGRIKIGDYGLSKAFDHESELTQTGTFMGTPQFAAPEQIRGSEVDQRADIYAIGATLFYLLTGRPPFVGNAAQVIAGIASEPAPRASRLNDNVPRVLERVIERALDKNPDRRPQGVKELRSLLQPFSTRGVSRADIGRRIAAYSVDLLLAFVLASLMGPILEWIGLFMISQAGLEPSVSWIKLQVVIQLMLVILYFSLAESIWGRTPGKWLMGMRVIDQYNETPNFGSALVRASLIPGIGYAVSGAGAWLVDEIPLKELDAAAEISLIVKTQILFLMGQLINLALLSTARVANGYQGIHGVLSRTRVVRLAQALERKRPTKIPPNPPLALDSSSPWKSDNFPQLRLIGRYRSSHPQTDDIIVARDEVLDRNVWLLRVCQEVADQPLTTNVRPNRVRVLARHHVGDTWWLECEAVDGVPLLDFLQSSPRLDWSSLLPLIEEIAAELLEMNRESSGTPIVSLDQIWITRGGRIKFFLYPDLARVNSQVPPHMRPPAIAPTADWMSAPITNGLAPIALIERLMRAIVSRHAVPEHVLTFWRQLPELNDTKEGLTIVNQQLQNMEDRPSTWRWDDRLGVAAVSMFFEFSILSSLMILSGLLICFLCGWPSWITGLTTFFAAFALLLISGTLLKGGFAFWLTGVALIDNRTLTPVSRFRILLRQGLSWLVPTFWLAIVVTIIDLRIAHPNELADAAGFGRYSTSLIWLAILLPLLMGTGIVYAILRPSRGIIDILVGTRLMRK